MSSLFDFGVPLLRLLPAETAHTVTIRALAAGIAPRTRPADPPSLATKLWGLNFPNPIGLAAGFDKNAEVPDAMLAFGFGFVEAGTITPLPQKGNPKPRLFRLPEDRAVINRLGFNGGGLEPAAQRLALRHNQPGIVGANIGKNRDTQDDIGDYVQGVRVLAPLADYLTVNISSPNTPGLRDLQRRSMVMRLIGELLEARQKATPHHAPPLLVKIAPDLTAEERVDLAEAALSTDIDGLIVSNTTVARPASLQSRSAHEPGGLSGKPLFAASTALVAEMYRLTSGRVPIIGVGGIASGADAYKKIRAGASLVQLYSALVFHGPGLVQDIARDLAALLARDGFTSISAAVGADAHLPSTTPHGL
jgi:dihydroorotate dehydrogenase